MTAPLGIALRALRATFAGCWLLFGAASSGCGGAAFHGIRHEPPAIDTVGAREIWIATDTTDTVSRRIAERLTHALGDLVPAQTVSVGRPPEADVVVLSLAIRRSVSHRPALVQQPVWSCDPSGVCYARDMPRVLDVPEVRVLVRVSAHASSGRLLLAPRILDESRAGDDEISAETSLVAVVSARLARLFHETNEEVALAVESPDDEDARRALQAALASPDPDRCDALAARAERTPERRARARLLFDAGQCHRALALAPDAPLAERALARAEALLLAAVRGQPSALYARALAETRAALAQRRPSIEQGPPATPDPPPSYQ